MRKKETLTFARHFSVKRRSFAKTGSGQTHREKLEGKRGVYFAGEREELELWMEMLTDASAASHADNHAAGGASISSVGACVDDTHTHSALGYTLYMYSICVGVYVTGPVLLPML